MPKAWNEAPRLELPSSNDLNPNKAFPRGQETAPSDMPHWGPVRLVGLKDTGYRKRIAWLQEWFRPVSSLAFAHDCVRAIAQAEHPFSALILHGDDAPRMSRIVREWSTALPEKIFAAFLSASTPEKRAELFRSGCDYVFDLDTPGPVALAALSAAFRRQALSAGCAPPAELPMTLASPLTASEKRILELLRGCYGKIVHYDQILVHLGKTPSSQAVKGLHVQIYRLRKKILAGVKIENSKAGGYKISIPALSPPLSHHLRRRANLGSGEPLT